MTYFILPLLQYSSTLFYVYFIICFIGHDTFDSKWVCVYVWCDITRTFLSCLFLSTSVGDYYMKMCSTIWNKTVHYNIISCEKKTTTQVRNRTLPSLHNNNDTNYIACKVSVTVVLSWVPPERLQDVISERSATDQHG